MNLISITATLVPRESHKGGGHSKYYKICAPGHPLIRHTFCSLSASPTFPEAGRSVPRAGAGDKHSGGSIGSAVKRQGTWEVTEAKGK